MKAIKEIGGDLLSAYDPFDSIGILDSHFPNTYFSSEFEPYYADLLRRNSGEKKVNYISICSPNYLHRSHSELAMHAGSDVICEKPICLSKEDLVQMQKKESETGHKVNCILQLRLHSEVERLRQSIVSQAKDTVNDVSLTYVTSRGSWYASSWKNQFNKSGGILQNIGIHFFDMLIFVFGDVVEKKIFVKNETTAIGYLRLERARVRWLVSIDSHYLPKSTSSRTFRNILINNENFEMSDGFTELHTKSYQEILAGNGFGLEAALPSVSLTEELNASDIVSPEDRELIKALI